MPPQNKEYSDTDQQIRRKIERLRQTVYPQKRISILKTKSHCSLPIKFMPNLKKRNSPIKKRNPQITEQKLSAETARLKRTTLQFGHNKITKAQITASYSAQNWMSGNHQTFKRQSIEFKQQRDQNKYNITNDRWILSQQKILSKFQSKDGRSLLRKNSLFLLSFIQTRQKKKFRKFPSGQFPQFPILQEKIKPKYQQRPLNRQQREKNYLQSIKNIKEEQKIEKVINLLGTTLYPEPW